MLNMLEGRWERGQHPGKPEGIVDVVGDGREGKRRKGEERRGRRPSLVPLSVQKGKGKGLVQST